MSVPPRTDTQVGVEGNSHNEVRIPQGCQGGERRGLCRRHSLALGRKDLFVASARIPRDGSEISQISAAFLSEVFGYPP